MQLTIDVRRAQPRRRGLLAGALIALPLVFVGLKFLATAPPHSFDLSVSRAAHDFTWDHSQTVWRVCRALAWLFSTWVVSAFVGALAALALWQRRYRIALWLVASGAVTILGNKVLKGEFHRMRPHFNPPLDGIGGYSFPSGHSAAGAMVAVTLILLTVSMTHRGWRRSALTTGWAALAVSVAASRVLLGVHFPTDVLAGLAFGTFVTLGLWVLMLGDPRRLPRPSHDGTAPRAAVVLNPTKVGDVNAFKARVRSASEAAGWREPLWFETTVDDPGRGQAHAALSAGVALVLAAGGDGTVREVCQEAARTGVPVGILPHGTGNLLARNLGIPLNARGALEVAFDGEDRAVDLATFETDTGVSTSFLVMAGAGFDAMIMGGVDDGLKKKVGWWAYVVSGIKALRFPRMTVTLTIDDGEPVTMRARTVVIGNVGFLQAGLPLMPDAEIDDGLLDVVVLAPRRLLGWLWIAVKVLARRDGRADRLARFRGRRVQVDSVASMPMQLDGDPIGDARRLVAEAHPGVLLVRVPSR